MSSFITLRRASKLRNRLTERLSELSTELRTTTLNVSVYEVNIPYLLTDKANKYNAVMARFIAVSRALHDVRQSIAQVNKNENVNELLTQQVTLKGRIAVLRQLAVIQEPMLDPARINNLVEGTRERAKTATYGSTDLHFSFVTAEMIDAAKKQINTMQAELDEIQDQLESINSNKTLELSDSTVAVLTQEQLA